MRLLVIAATEAEISGWRSSGLSGDLLITGVGVTHSLYRISRALADHHYDMVIQAGVAGSFHQGLALGEVVAVASDAFADEGILENGVFTSLATSNLAPSDPFPFQDGLLINSNIPVHFRKVSGVTTGLISDDNAAISRLTSAFSPDIESMEGACFHFVALMEKVPFLQLRAISNFVGDRNKENWKLDEAITNLNEVLIRYCKTLDAHRVV